MHGNVFFHAGDFKVAVVVKTSSAVPEPYPVVYLGELTVFPDWEAVADIHAKLGAALEKRPAQAPPAAEYETVAQIEPVVLEPPAAEAGPVCVHCGKTIEELEPFTHDRGDTTKPCHVHDCTAAELEPPGELCIGSIVVDDDKPF